MKKFDDPPRGQTSGSLQLFTKAMRNNPALRDEQYRQLAARKRS